MTDAPDDATAAELTIVIPTYNERENVEPLVAALDAALRSVRWTALFVDDGSPDGTADAVLEIGHRDARVRCLQRQGRRSLAAACIDGLNASETPYLAVMDADLQHDESRLVEMLNRIREQSLEVVVATRYGEHGSVGDWTAERAAGSRIATWIGRFFVPPGLTDPMSGFFMIRRETFLGLAHRLSGRGFKILLDIFASAGRPLKFSEIPYTFRPRRAGDSKLDGRIVWEFVELLVEKTLGHVVPVRFVMFVGVGATGVAVHVAVLGLGTQALVLPFAAAQLAAIVAAMTSNFAFNNLVTFRDRALSGRQWARGLLSFYVACGLGAGLNFSVGVVLSELGAPWALAGFAGAVAGAVWNFTTTSAFTWR